MYLFIRVSYTERGIGVSSNLIWTLSMINYQRLGSLTAHRSAQFYFLRRFDNDACQANSATRLLHNPRISLNPTPHWSHFTSNYIPRVASSFVANWLSVSARRGDDDLTFLTDACETTINGVDFIYTPRAIVPLHHYRHSQFIRHSVFTIDVGQSINGFALLVSGE